MKGSRDRLSVWEHEQLQMKNSTRKLDILDTISATV